MCVGGVTLALLGCGCRGAETFGLGTPLTLKRLCCILLLVDSRRPSKPCSVTAHTSELLNCILQLLRLR